MKKIFLLAVFCVVSLTAFAQPVATAAYTARNAVIREAPAKVAAAYVTISNPTAENDTLIGAKADWADHIQMHKVSINDRGVMEMSPVNEIALPAHGTAELKQGGYHLMISGIKEKLSIDQKKDITLLFKKAGALVIPFEVQPIGNASQAAMHDHMMMDMN
jgi:copper(I)-binding protein